jgi:6-phosphofructokinase 1
MSRRGSIGGNDCRYVAPGCRSVQPYVIGVPKTIDNDLPATDHCPGYGSAARFVAAITAETARDTWAMRATDPIRS